MQYFFIGLVNNSLQLIRITQFFGQVGQRTPIVDNCDSPDFFQDGFKIHSYVGDLQFGCQ